jgi:hypothetical protein
LKNLPDLLANLGAPWFTRDQHRPAILSQPGNQPVDVGGLSATFSPFKSNKFADLAHFGGFRG